MEARLWTRRRSAHGETDVRPGNEVRVFDLRPLPRRAGLRKRHRQAVRSVCDRGVIAADRRGAWWFQQFEGGGQDGDTRYGTHPSHSIGMPARDLARVAYCMLRGGKWKDKQVVPKWFVDETAAPTHNVKEPELRFQPRRRIVFARLGTARPVEGRSGHSGRRALQAGLRRTDDLLHPSLDLVVTRQTGGSGAWEYEEYVRRACAAVVAEK